MSTLTPCIVESPYAGDVDLHLTYVRHALSHCLHQGRAPFASHALYTQPDVLDDRVQGERELGINAGFAWWDAATEIHFFVDLGVSSGMFAAYERAVEAEKEVFAHFLPGWERYHDTFCRKLGPAAGDAINTPLRWLKFLVSRARNTGQFAVI